MNTTSKRVLWLFVDGKQVADSQNRLSSIVYYRAGSISVATHNAKRCTLAEFKAFALGKGVDVNGAEWAVRLPDNTLIEQRWVDNPDGKVEA